MGEDVPRARPRDPNKGHFRAEEVFCPQRIGLIATRLTIRLCAHVRSNEAAADGRMFPGLPVRAAPDTPAYMREYASMQYPDGSASAFYSLAEPDAPLADYVCRLVKRARACRAVFVAALVLLDRVHKADDASALCSLNVHRLLATAVLVASKAVEDNSIRNSYMARISGIPTTAEMNLLERHFLERLSWNASIDVDAFKLHDRNLFGDL